MRRLCASGRKRRIGWQRNGNKLRRITRRRGSWTRLPRKRKQMTRQRGKEAGTGGQGKEEEEDSGSENDSCQGGGPGQGSRKLRCGQKTMRWSNRCVSPFFR